MRTGQLLKIRENGATTGIGVLATYTYDNLARRTGVTNGNGTTSSYGFDPVSRLNSLTQNLAGTLNDLTVTISAYNPASQIVTQARSNDLYAWTGHGNGSTDTVTNGLNQLSTVGGVAATHDPRGSLTTDPTNGNSYAYSSENLLTSATVSGNAVTLAYDPLLRLTQVAGTATTRFGYDGTDTLVEADGTGTILRRYAPGDAIDEPVVWYEGSGTATRRWLHADERGSIVAVSDASGNMLAINSYDEFGKPGASNQGQFQYIGQKWIGELGLYDDKARLYAPALGRFLQTDPVGYDSGPNLYAYVRGDPINLSDPLGLWGSADQPNFVHRNECTGSLICPADYESSSPIQTASGGVYGLVAGDGGGHSLFVPPTGAIVITGSLSQPAFGFQNLPGVSVLNASVGDACLTPACISLIPPNPTVLANILDKHSGSKQNKSVFGPRLGNMTSLQKYILETIRMSVGYNITTGDPMIGVYTRIFDHPTGIDRAGYISYALTVVLRWTGLYNSEGQRYMLLVTAHPGYADNVDYFQ